MRVQYFASQSCLDFRSDIFELFDMTMLLSQGNMMYYGKAAQMIPYFTEVGYPCPPLTNPCDFYGKQFTLHSALSSLHGCTCTCIVYNLCNFHFSGFDNHRQKERRNGVSFV